VRWTWGRISYLCLLTTLGCYLHQHLLILISTMIATIETVSNQVYIQPSLELSHVTKHWQEGLLFMHAKVPTAIA
jgi:hypothetical protein